MRLHIDVGLRWTVSEGGSTLIIIVGLDAVGGSGRVAPAVRDNGRVVPAIQESGCVVPAVRNSGCVVYCLQQEGLCCLCIVTCAL